MALSHESLYIWIDIIKTPRRIHINLNINTKVVHWQGAENHKGKHHNIYLGARRRGFILMIRYY